MQAVNVEESDLTLEVPPGDYKVTWINTLNGEMIDEEQRSTENNRLEIGILFFTGEMAIKVERIQASD